MLKQILCGVDYAWELQPITIEMADMPEDWKLDPTEAEEAEIINEE